ncbi:EthD domain-containing protein [Nocardia nepalensis]|uniref:EthD domain-containing protein n=1 Tax=Nocardia nepalensis TaxID=3375448 RepID=UPI003B67708F
MNKPEHPDTVTMAASSRRGFLVGAAGATAAGIGAIAALRAQPAAAEPPGAAVKMVAALRRRPDLSPEDFYHYWLYQHGPLATQLVQQLGAYRYVQSHTDSVDLGLLLATSRGQVGQAYDGLVEVWFPSREVLQNSMTSPEGAQANLRLAQDETNFIDLPRSSYFLAAEHVLLG